jgi:hypothetical protein
MPLQCDPNGNDNVYLDDHNYDSRARGPKVVDRREQWGKASTTPLGRPSLHYGLRLSVLHPF